MKVIYRLAADGIFLLHFFVVVIALFGWTSSRFWNVYMLVLVATLISDVVFGYCILSRWEFEIRKKINPKTDYDFTWATYYTYKLINLRIPNYYYIRVAVIFLIVSISTNIYFKFIYK